jgi:hypothetical protein
MASRIRADEIIIIDKVNAEMRGLPDYITMLDGLSGKVVDTSALSSRVLQLSQDYYLQEKEKYYKDEQGQVDQNRIAVEYNDFVSKYADLFLVAKCLEIKDLGDEPILISSETTNTKWNTKLIQKIPIICREKDIRCEEISTLLFERFKKDLKFDLDAPSETQNPQANSQS